MLVQPVRIEEVKSHSLLPLIYGTGFLFYLHAYLPMYVGSTFIEGYIGENFLGILYAIGSLAAIFGLIVMPKVLNRFGNYKTTIFVSLAQVLATLALAFSVEPIVLAINFVLMLVLIPILSYNLDLFLEKYSTDERTGSIRGTFLALTNTTLVISPFIAGLILGNTENYSRLYFVAAIILLIFLGFFAKKFKKYGDPKYKNAHFIETLKGIWKRDDLRNVLMANTILRFFYAWMTIYTPIYLHEYLGMGWGEIGIIFTIMLIPYATIELPLGKIADNKFGEKEILTIGFVVMAITTIFLSFITSPSVLVWAIILFLTRLGASAVEIMTETYFFKRISSQDSPMLGIYRMVYPAAYVAAPIAATVFLLFFDLRWVFLALGLVCLYGIRYSLAITDTR